MSWFDGCTYGSGRMGSSAKESPEHLADKINYSKEEVRIMKTPLFSLVVAVLGTPLLAHAVNPPTDGFCSHASLTAKTVINFLLALIGQGPIC